MTIVDEYLQAASVLADGKIRLERSLEQAHEQLIQAQAKVVFLTDQLAEFAIKLAEAKQKAIDELKSEG